MRFHEQLNISKWRSLPVVLFANIPTRRGINLVHESREFQSQDSFLLYDIDSNSLLSQTVVRLPICTACRSSKRHLATRARLPFRPCSVWSVRITVHRPPLRPTEKASWTFSPWRPAGSLMPHARTFPRFRSRRGSILLVSSAAIIPGAFPLHGAEVSFCLVLGISHVYRLLGRPRVFDNSVFFATNLKPLIAQSDVWCTCARSLTRARRCKVKIYSSYGNVFP
jgi:hypothetical protein